MNRVMAWVKSNVAIVASIAVIVLVLPAAWFGSSWWNNKIRTGREAAATAAMRDLDGLRVSYTLAQPYSTAAAVTVPSEAPNPEFTKLFKESRQKLDEQLAEVGKVAEQINKEGHTPLIEGLFPKPADPLLTLTFAEALVGKTEHTSAYDALLKSINAGGPYDAAQLVELLNEERTQRIERVRAETGRDKLTTEEEAEMARGLANTRLAEYQRYARGVSVYATIDSFPQAPKAVPTEPPDVATCFMQQFDLWVAQDLLRAVDSANQQDGKRTGVEKSVVKRIEKVSVDPWALPQATAPGQAAPPPAAPATFTGRKGGGSAGPYDLRYAELTVVVSSARLPELLNAVSRTNFMTVTGIEYWDLDNPWSDLEQGYYYGGEHVVRAHLKIESVWLRSWTGPLMPDAIKDQLKAAEAAAEPPPPPPPPPRAAAEPEKPRKPLKGSTKRPTDKSRKMGGGEGP